MIKVYKQGVNVVIEDYYSVGSRTIIPTASTRFEVGSEAVVITDIFPGKDDRFVIPYTELADADGVAQDTKTKAITYLSEFIGAHSFFFRPAITWAEALSNGNLSGGTNPTLSNGDKIVAENGNSFLDLRKNNIDGKATLNNIITVTDSNVINSKAVEIDFKANGQYVSIGGANKVNNANFCLNGMFSQTVPRMFIGTTMNQPSAINMKGGMRLLWEGTDAIRPIGYQSSGFTFNSQFNKFSFQERYQSYNFIEINQNNLSITGRKASNIQDFDSGIFSINARYWDNTSNSSKNNAFEFQVFNKDTNNQPYLSIAKNGVETYRIYEDNSFAQKSDTNKWVKWQTIESSPNVFTLQATQI